MDRISLLSDDTILKILSFVPTKVAMTTAVLSKRWRYLWKYVAKLEYFDPSRHSEHWRASRFVDKFLLLHKATVLENLHLKLSQNCPATDIETWISVAISRGVHTIHIFQYGSSSVHIRLPRSLFASETLVTLQLQAPFIVDDVPFTVCLRSLKVLHLVLVKFSSDEIVQRFLSGCPVLEDLIVIRHRDDKLKTFTIAVPSLQKLQVVDFGFQDAPGDNVGEFVIKAPSLQSLSMSSRCNGLCSLLQMPYLVKASIKLRHSDTKKFQGCLVSAKHVFLCLQPPMDSSSVGVFNQLVSLNLCRCSLDWCSLILKHAPKLRLLVFELKKASISKNQNSFLECCSSSVNLPTQWEQPSSVPECLISSLETVQWIGYKGTQVEKKVVLYFLDNSTQLKTMAIGSLVSTSDTEKLKMLQELSSAQRISTKCQLSFT